MISRGNDLVESIKVGVKDNQLGTVQMNTIRSNELTL